MSDNMKFILIMTEGPHDVSAIGKILRIRGFQELDIKQEIPEELQVFIPKQYPFDDNGRMKWAVPRPTYLSKKENYVVIFNVGGISEIAGKMADSLSLLRASVLQMLCGIAIITDMDNLDREARLKALLNELESKMEDAQINKLSENEVKITNDTGTFPLYFFFFPDNSSKGTLENLLIDGAQIIYPDLLTGAQHYIDNAKERYPLHNFDDLKATVGAVANVLKPGRANQVSIHDNDWFTKESLERLENHKRFATFLDSMLSLMEKDRKVD